MLLWKTGTEVRWILESQIRIILTQIKVFGPSCRSPNPHHPQTESFIVYLSPCETCWVKVGSDSAAGLKWF